MCIRDSFDAASHPEVLAGRQSGNRAFSEFLDTFDVPENKAAGVDEFLKYLSAAWVRHFSATSVFELEEDERNRSALVGRRSGRSKRGSGESEEEESWVGLAAARSQPTSGRASVAKSVDFAESSKGRDGGTMRSIRLSLMRTWG